jgi:hypothetical protein
MNFIDLIKIIRQKEECGLTEAKHRAETLLKNARTPTKRELFAAMIYQGMCTIPDNIENRKISARYAVECADELLEALDK